MPDVSKEKKPRTLTEGQEPPVGLPRPLRRLRGVRGQLAIAGLASLATIAGMNTVGGGNRQNASEGESLPDSTISLQTSQTISTQTSEPTSQINVNDESSPEPTPEHTPEPTPESERAIYEREIEQKYGIELLSQKEGYERIGKEYDESNERLVGDAPPVRWSMDKLKTINELFSYLPPNTYEPRSGKKFAISLWDYAIGEEYLGMSHGGGAEMISVHQNSFNGNNKKDDFSLLAHELMGHRNDSPELKQKINDILSDQGFLSNDVFKGDNKYHTGNPDSQVAADTLGSFAPGQSSGEGRAGFAQLYVKGYERFMKAVGPILDGGDFVTNAPREELESLYPRSQQIYHLYYNLYKGKQFDEISKKLDPDFRYTVPINTEAVNSTTDSSESVQETEVADADFIEYFKARNNVHFVNLVDQLTMQDMNYLDSYLYYLFPQELFSNLDGEELTIILADEADNIAAVQHNGKTIALTKESLSSIKENDWRKSAIITIAHGLAHRANELNGHETEDKLVEMLGGEKFLSNPEDLYPRLFEESEIDEVEEVRKRFLNEKGSLRNPDEIIATLAELYVQGESRFEILQHLFDPPNLFPPGHSSEAEDGDQKYNKKIYRIKRGATYFHLYLLVGREVFAWNEYNYAINGFPYPEKTLDL